MFESLEVGRYLYSRVCKSFSHHTFNSGRQDVSSQSPFSISDSFKAWHNTKCVYWMLHQVCMKPAYKLTYWLMMSSHDDVVHSDNSIRVRFADPFSIDFNRGSHSSVVFLKLENVVQSFSKPFLLSNSKLFLSRTNNWNPLLIPWKFSPVLALTPLTLTLVPTGSSTLGGVSSSPCWMPVTQTQLLKRRRWSPSTVPHSASGRTPLWLEFCSHTDLTQGTTQTVSCKNLTNDKLNFQNKYC